MDCSDLCKRWDTRASERGNGPFSCICSSVAAYPLLKVWTCYRPNRLFWPRQEKECTVYRKVSQQRCVTCLWMDLFAVWVENSLLRTELSLVAEPKHLNVFYITFLKGYFQVRVLLYREFHLHGNYSWCKLFVELYFTVFKGKKSKQKQLLDNTTYQCYS